MTKLDVLDEKIWKDLKDIMMFGYGRQGKKMYETLKRDFHICAIVENDEQKRGRKVDDITICSFEEAREQVGNCKIIVTVSEHYYVDIKKQLEEAGLTENVDFVMYHQFIAEWYFKFRQKIYVTKTDLSLTSYCNLNCRHCMQFLPFWKKRHETSLEECKDNLDCYFQCVDYVMEMDFIGGEPFLYRYLPEIITYVGERYRSRIGYLGFITNGLMMPEEEILNLMKKYNVTISISDYSKNLHYEEKMDALCKRLDDMGIVYYKNENIDWFDFGFPENLYHYEGEAARKHMKLCNNIQHVLDEKKLYYCGLEWSAQKGKLHEPDENNYIDLCEMAGKALAERKKILEMLLGNIPGGYIQFCKVCGGFGIDNNNRVATAQQYRPVGELR